MNIEHKLRDIRSDWESRGFGFEYWIDPPGRSGAISCTTWMNS